MSDDNLLQAIKEGMQKAGWQSPADDTLRQIAFSINNMDSRIANEALKEQRRKEAVTAITNMRLTEISVKDFLVQVEARVKEAQG